MAQRACDRKALTRDEALCLRGYVAAISAMLEDKAERAQASAKALSEAAEAMDRATANLEAAQTGALTASAAAAEAKEAWAALAKASHAAAHPASQQP